MKNWYWPRQICRGQHQFSVHSGSRTAPAGLPVIIGVGIDVCDVERFGQVLERRPGLVQRLFTPTEAGRPVASLAARFAAKEALAKALGAPQGMSWQDAEIVTDASGRPSFVVRGTVAAQASAAGVVSIHVSLSHDAGIASAVVICEG